MSGLDFLVELYFRLYWEYGLHRFADVACYAAVLAAPAASGFEFDVMLLEQALRLKALKLYPKVDSGLSSQIREVH